MLEVKNVSKSYGDFKAVDAISFNAPPGQIIGLIGPNGAGKTTIIRTIMNILEKDSGEILLNEQPFTLENSNEIGYLPEERGLYKKQKIETVLHYLGELKGMDKNTRIQKIDFWLNRFNLLEWKSKKIEDLSKGMAQKVQFISSILHDPKIVILDEPFSGLDPVSSDELLSIMSELKQGGRIILFSTHVMEQAEKICDTIILINKSKKILDGSLKSIKAQYKADTIIVDFLGEGLDLCNLKSIESSEAISASQVSLKLKKDTSLNTILPELLECANEQGVVLTSMRLSEMSLHDIFIHLVTSKEVA